MPELTEEVIREINDTKEAAIMEKQQTKSLEREKQRIEKLRNADVIAYYDAVKTFETQSREREFEKQKSDLLNIQQNEENYFLKSPQLFKQSADKIDEERKKFRDLSRMSTFKPAFLKEEE